VLVSFCRWHSFYITSQLLYLISFFNHINSISPHIQFSMETQKDNVIPFLDVLNSSLSYGSLSHQVYKKKTHIYTYLHTSSHHHPTRKPPILKGLIIGAIRIFAPQFIMEEKSHLTKTMLSNGYYLSQINHVFHSANNPK